MTSRVSSSFRVGLEEDSDDCVSEDYDFDPFFQEPYNKPYRDAEHPQEPLVDAEGNV